MKLNRFISVLLVFTVLISLFALAVPTAGFAEDEEEDKGFVWEKRVSYIGDGSYLIEMEAYAKGTTVVTTTEVPVPCDIVMVLDTSGSMSEEITGSSLIGAVMSLSYSDLSGGGYYFLWTDGQYYPIKGIGNKHGALWNYRTWAYFDVGSDRYYLSGSEVIKAVDQTDPTYDGSSGAKPYRADDPTKAIDPHEQADTDIFSNTVYSSKVTKLGALKTAACAFLDEVYDHGSKNKLEHRVAIVEFASDGYLRSDFTVVNTQEQLQELKDIITDFVAGGATAADYGMEKAETVLKNSRKDCAKSVLLFTDGAPTHGETDDDFSGDSEAIGVATDTIEVSKRLKAADVSVYTVGAFNKETESIRKYMNGVSSNYPEASSYNSLGSGSDKGFYMVASDANGLVSVFKTVAKETLSGKSAVALSTKTVLTDIIADIFYIPNGIQSVSVYTADYNASTGTFGTKNAFSDANVKVDGNTVTVTGFDYSAHWCGEGASAGQKLIVNVIIKPKDGVVLDGGNVETNLEGSGISDEEAGIDFPFKKPEVTPKAVTFKLVDADGKKIAENVVEYYLPGVSVKRAAPVVNGYTPTEEYKEFTMLNSAMEFTFKYNIDTYTITYDSDGGSSVESASYKVTDSVTLAGAPEKEGYTFKGWSNAAEGGSWKKTTYAAGKSMGTGNYGNVTLKALWEENTATISYMSIGGEGTESWGSVKLSSDPTKTGNLISEEIGAVTGTPGAAATAASDDYEFAGWYDNALGQGNPLSTNASFSPAKSGNTYSDKTYYAIFRPRTTTLTVNRQGLEPGENCVIKITGKGIEDGLILIIPGDSGTVTLSGIYVGEEYTVEELPWSRAGGSGQTKDITTVKDGTQNVVTLTATGKPSHWLRAETCIKNIFGIKA